MDNNSSKRNTINISDDTHVPILNYAPIHNTKGKNLYRLARAFNLMNFVFIAYLISLLINALIIYDYIDIGEGSIEHQLLRFFALTCTAVCFACAILVFLFTGIHPLSILLAFSIFICPIIWLYILPAIVAHIIARSYLQKYEIKTGFCYTKNKTLKQLKEFANKQEDQESVLESPVLSDAHTKRNQ